jgi:hypothetical protein
VCATPAAVGNLHSLWLQNHAHVWPFSLIKELSSCPQFHFSVTAIYEHACTHAVQLTPPRLNYYVISYGTVLCGAQALISSHLRTCHAQKQISDRPPSSILRNLALDMVGDKREQKNHAPSSSSFLISPFRLSIKTLYNTVIELERVNTQHSVRHPIWTGQSTPMATAVARRAATWIFSVVTTR